MGAPLSILAKMGFPAVQSLSPDDIFVEFFSHNIRDFGQFHIAFLGFCNKFNSTLPGKHFQAPPIDDIWECYRLWLVGITDEEKKHRLLELLEKNVTMNQVEDDTLLMAGLVAPPAAMILKRMVPDVLFVPSFTLLAMVAVKVIQINKITKLG